MKIAYRFNALYSTRIRHRSLFNNPNNIKQAQEAFQKEHVPTYLKGRYGKPTYAFGAVAVMSSVAFTLYAAGHMIFGTNKIH